MNEHNLSYREVIPDQTLPSKWKEVSLNTGGTQSTLQDIKIAEKANGYCYRDATRQVTRNRFIYWRITNDILELVEQSLDLNLSGNKIRYKFVDTPVLDGITIHETYMNVIVLVPTVCSVHRLLFPHPDRLHKQDELLDTHPDLAVPSIFSDVASVQNRDTSFYHFIGPSTANSQLPHSAASWLTMEDEANFLLAYPSGELILVRQQSNGDGDTIDLKYESLMPKFLSGMFRSRSADNNVIVSMILHTIRLETYAITLCRDGHLRVWSCSKATCVAVSDILSESMSGRQLEQGAQTHMLKKVVGTDETNFIFAAFLSFSYNSHFDILKPVINGSQFAIVKLYSLQSPVGDLIDFSLTPNRIWSIWRGTDGEWNAYSALVSPENDRSTRWVPVVLETLPNPDELPIDESLDPRQMYLQYIFHPGRFPLQIISKALSIYKRSQIMSDLNVSASTLKQRVCLAIENEIQAQLQECEVEDEDYLECANLCWSRFYSCCVQYHVAGLRPLGLLLLPSVSGAVLLKKSMYSFLRPLDILEHLMLCSENISIDTIYGHPQLSNTKEECSDLIMLSSILVYLEEQLNDVFKIMFDKAMSQAMHPSEAMNELMAEIEMEDSFLETVKEQLKLCTDLYSAIHKLLELLRMDQPIPESSEFPKELKSSVMHLFSSNLGVSVIAECFSQQTSIKFAICRNLLLLQHIMLEEGSDETVFEAIRSVCMPEVTILLQSYYALCWSSELSASPTLSLDSQGQRLSVLKLAPVFNLKPKSQQLHSLIELYAGSTGGSDAHKALLKYDFDEESLSHWHTSLLPYLTQFTLIIWPINGNASFTEWLLSSGQHVHLQQYVSLLDSWCDWNNLTRSFLLGVSFLNSGEIQKAYDLFVQSSKGIYLEQFLMDRVGNVDGAKAFILYYLKVIQLFELHGAKDYAIEAANSALAGVVDNDEEPLKNTLYSIKFKHHLALGHYNDAFDALSTNPDEERKKDNLRDLIKTLLDGKQLKVLMSYNYGDLEDMFIEILNSRARACDTVDNIYYDFLYAFAVSKGFLRFSAAVMYEQAYRLNQHNSIEALEKHVKCLLVSVNSLCLIDPRFRWVLRPSDPDMPDEEHVLPVLITSDEEHEVIHFKKKAELMTLPDIKKELVFQKARLQLVRMKPNSISTSVSNVQELITMLATAGIFKTAFEVCKVYDAPMDIIFAILTHHCIHLSFMDSKESDNAWNWLTENNLHDLDFIGDSPSSIAWTLLRTYLEEFEPENLSIYHNIVAKKILQMRYYIPHWLLDSYKKRNSSELLYVLYSSGYLSDAADFAIDYLKAALGYGPEYFGIAESLTSVAKPLCLPLNIIDGLLYEMQLQNESDETAPLENEYKKLRKIFEKYLQTASRVSVDVCREKMTGLY